MKLTPTQAAYYRNFYNTLKKCGEQYAEISNMCDYILGMPALAPKNEVTAYLPRTSDNTMLAIMLHSVSATHSDGFSVDFNIDINIVKELFVEHSIMAINLAAIDEVVGGN